MFPRLFHNFDLPSFLLGISAGALIWTLSLITKSVIKTIQRQAHAQRESDQNDRATKAGNTLMGYMLHFVQSEHLLGKYFQLDDLAIEPRYLAFPKYLFPSDMNARADSFHDHLPFLPFCPEYRIQALIPGFSLEDALRSYDRIAIIGESGSGKTTAICQSISKLLRDSIPRKDNDNLRYPIYIDHFMISSIINENPNVELVDVISSVVTENVSTLSLKATRKFVETALNSGSIMLFIDGLDELPKNLYDLAIRWIETILDKYPSMKIIITASPHYFGGIFRACFSPIILAPWNSNEKSIFVKHALHLLNLSTISRSSLPSLPPSVTDQLIAQWILENSSLDRPIDLVIKVFAAFTRTQIISEKNGPITTFLESFVDTNAQKEDLSRFAGDLIGRNHPYHKIDDRPSKQESEAVIMHENVLPKHMDGLLAAGIFRKNVSGWVKFSNPYFVSAFAALTEQPGLYAQHQEGAWVTWAVAQDHAILTTNKDHLHAFLEPSINDLSPDQGNFLQMLRWYRNIPNNDPAKSRLLRRLLQQVQNSSLSFPLRSWILIAGMAENPDAPAFIKRMLASKDSCIRKLGYLAICASGDRQFLSILQSQIDHENGSNKIICWLGLYLLSLENIHTLCTKNIQNGDEELRMVTAEILAVLDARGQSILSENTRSNDLLTRIAAIHGLGFVRTDEARSYLAKTAVADEQWIIRKSSEVALEAINSPPSLCPHSILDMNNDEWLIQYAAMMGMGINPNSVPVDLLRNALDSEIPDEFRNAAIRLPRYSDSALIEPLSNKLTVHANIEPSVLLYYLWLNHHAGSPAID